MTTTPTPHDDDLTFGKSIGLCAYEKADDGEKAVIKFGMTPLTLIEKMNLSLDDMRGDFGQGFTLGLYAGAKQDGGMRA